LWAGADRVVVDEVQKSPELLSAIKQEVDRRRRKVRFVLSGSSNLMTMQRVSESLAGRAVAFRLWPMTLSESLGSKAPGLIARLLAGRLPRESDLDTAPDLARSLIRGFMPPVLEMKDSNPAIQWWDGYVATYLERDLRQISQVDSLPDFRRVMEALALRSGQLLNQTEVARDVGVSQSTVHRYIGLLETSMVFSRLPAFAVNRTKRLVKSPKAYWMDPGLAAFLARQHDTQSLLDARESGGLFETLVLLQLRLEAELSIPRARLFYWRTTTGKECDFVLERGRDLVAFEVKLTTRPRYADLVGLQEFMKEYPETKAGVLVHGGTRIQRLDQRVIAVPWSLLG
ncbi:MAG: ATP-binding protein, partial [Planctomycetota bacterium]